MATLITPTAGVTYKFVFQPGYEKFNGVYNVLRIMTYDEYIADGGDILQDFFTPCGKDEADIVGDLINIRASKILKLLNPESDNDKEAIFAPLYYLQENPDHNVKKYYNMGIVATLGITEEPGDFQASAAMLVEQFEAVLGVEPKPHFVTLQSVWMTEPDYQDMLNKRDKDRLKVINYFSENNELRKRNSQFKTQIAAYEELIIRQDTLIKQYRKELGIEGD